MYLIQVSWLRNVSSNAFMIKGKGKNVKKVIYLGTVTKIIESAKNKLYTMYEIVSGIDINEDNDEDDPEQVFQYTLLTDYVNGDLIVLED